jgi:hypothetical protein
MTRSLVSFWAPCLVYILALFAILARLILDPEDETVRFFEMPLNLCRTEKPHIMEDSAVYIVTGV